MPLEIETALQHAGQVAPAVLASLSTAHVDIPQELKVIPGVEDILKEIISRVSQATEAVGAIIGSIDPAGAAQAVQNGSASATTINDAALKAATSKLGTALTVGPLLDKIEKILGDKGLQAQAKQGFAARGLTGGTDDVRGALRSITANSIDPAHIRGVIASVEHQQQLVNSPAAKATLLSAVNDLHTILYNFTRDATRLVQIIDTTIGSTFN
jgi:hypothetical protein